MQSVARFRIHIIYYLLMYPCFSVQYISYGKFDSWVHVCSPSASKNKNTKYQSCKMKSNQMNVQISIFWTFGEPLDALNHFHWFDRIFSIPRLSWVRSPSWNLCNTLSVAVFLCTCLDILIHLFTASSSIQVLWIMQFSFDGLMSLAQWSKRWNFGRSRNRKTLRRTASLASVA